MCSEGKALRASHPRNEERGTHASATSDAPTQRGKREAAGATATTGEQTGGERTQERSQRGTRRRRAQPQETKQRTLMMKPAVKRERSVARQITQKNKQTIITNETNG